MKGHESRDTERVDDLDKKSFGERFMYFCAAVDSTQRVLPCETKCGTRCDGEA